MAAPHFQRLDALDRALHDRWGNLALLGLHVGGLAAAVWAVCSALRWGAHAASAFIFAGLNSYPSASALLLVLALTAGGALWGWLGRLPGWGVAQQDGIALAIANVRCTEPTAEALALQPNAQQAAPRYLLPDLRTTAKKVALTLVTLGSGAAGGLEGPVVLVGETISAAWARLGGVRTLPGLRTLQIAGVAAAVSTLLGAPLTAAFFAAELLSAERLIYRQLAYALWAGVVTYGLNTAIRGYRPLFWGPDHAPVYALGEYTMAVAVAVMVSVPIAVGFAALVRRTRAALDRVPARSRGPAAGLAQGLVAAGLWLGLEIGPEHTLGMGEATISQILLRGSAGVGPMELWWGMALALCARALNTVLTIQSGGSAGMLVPTMVMGGVAGALTCTLLQPLLSQPLDPALFAVVGIASALVAVVGVPLSAMALVLEVFGKEFGPPALLAVGVTYLITLKLRSGDPS